MVSSRARITSQLLDYLIRQLTENANVLMLTYIPLIRFTNIVENVDIKTQGPQVLMGMSVVNPGFGHELENCKINIFTCWKSQGIIKVIRRHRMYAINY